MKIYKDNHHSVTLSPFSWRGKRTLMVSVGLFAAFDPENAASTLRTEQDFWKEAPEAFAALGQAPVMDMNLPKPAAEVLVAGFARTPDNKPVKAMEVSFRVGSTGRRLAVFGDRQRLAGGGVTEPVPFAAMPLVWERAFGGPDYPLNQAGMGLLADNAPAEALPNIEDPRHLLLSGDDLPEPACPLPIDLANPVRRAMSGTYDQHWLDTRWPHYPDDCAPDFFHSAQPIQRLDPAGPAFFRGDEEIEIMGMHHAYPCIRSRLPEARIRAFVLTAETFTPFAEKGQGEKKILPYAKNLDGPGIFHEVELRLDTVWLLPDLMGAFVLRRGLLPVADDEMDDILRVFVVTEKPSDPPQTLPFYLEELKKRTHPAVEIDIAPFAAAQAKITKLVKKARDVPKTLAKVKKNFLGQRPVMPLSFGDIAHDAQKTLSASRATLDTLEKQMLAQREQFSHVMSFDLSIFPRMRASIDAQESNLHTVLRDAAAEMDQMEAGFKQGLIKARANTEKLLTPPADASPKEVADKTAALKLVQAKLDELDNFTPQGVLCVPPPLAPWHDRGFPLVIAALRALKRHDPLLARLAAWGFEPATTGEAWIGYAPDAVTDSTEHWGLPEAPGGTAFTLPAGLYLPRFEGKKLAALTVYPLDDAENSPLRGLGEDAAALVRVPGSDETPLSLPPAHPGGAVIVAADDLSALFAEQETGDFCHIAVATAPADLAAIQDLPPLFPPEKGEGGPSDPSGAPEATPELPPLLILLPPQPQGKALFAVWQKNFPEALPLFLPEGCPHVLALAEQGHRLRRLVLDVLPPALAGVHDFDFPLPPKDKSMQPFTLNLPLPGKAELQGQINTMIEEIRSHFPDPQQLLEQTLAEQKEHALATMKRMDMSALAIAKVREAFDAPLPPPEEMPTIATLVKNQLAALEKMEAGLPENLPPEARKQVLAKLAEARVEVHALGEKLAPLDALHEEGMAKIEAAKRGELPPEIEEKFAAKGMDPNALKKPSRQEVEAILGRDKNLERRNLQGLDLSGLDFSGATLAHALCGKTSFAGCRMDGVDFTFTLANGADFTGASFREATFKQTVLQKALLRQSDFSTARVELTTLGECDCTGAVFDGATIKLCNFTKAILDNSSFAQAMLSLCAFSQGTALGANFARVRAFKCLFQKISLDRADFSQAVLNECLFQNAAAVGISLRGAELRKFYTDADTDLSRADFSGADLREASLRMSRFCGAEFYNARLEDALIVQCDLSRARLDGLNATGCRFIKCDLHEADLSGSSLRNGALRKCRLTATALEGANLYAANLRDILVDKNTAIRDANFKRTILDGKEEALRDAARRNS